MSHSCLSLFAILARRTHRALARCAAAAVVACAALLVATTTSSALTQEEFLRRGLHEYDWQRHFSTPFMNEREDHRLQHVEHLDHAEFNGREEGQKQIPLNLFFSPVPDAYLGGKLLGQGWWFPPFESTLLQRDGSTYILALPNGEKIKMQKTGKTISGLYWSGTLGDHETILKTDAGWNAKFQRGRLVELTSPMHERFQFAIDADGTRTITYNGRTVLTLTRKIDEKTTFPVYTLSYTADGKPRKAELRMGLRPIRVKYAEKENGRNVTKERVEDIPSLRMAHVTVWDKKYFIFTPNQITAPPVQYQWDEQTKQVVRINEEFIDFVKIQGIDCLRKRKANGETSLSGDDPMGTKRILQERSGPIVVTESFPFGAARDNVKKITHILPSGEEKVILQVWYNEKFKPIRAMMIDDNGRRILQTMLNDRFTIVDEATKKLFWESTYDKDGKLASCKIGEKEYSFDYKSKPPNIVVTLKGTEKTVEFSKARFDSIFGNYRDKNKFFNNLSQSTNNN